MNGQPILQVAGVSKRFAGLVAVNQVSFAVDPGEIVSIIGPNGAGKSTLFNLLTGQLKPSEGAVHYQGAPIGGLPPERRARLGMGRTFQIAKPLLALSALENVLVGAFLHQRRIATAEADAFALLAEVGLADRAAIPASELTLSERRQLEIARALATRPTLVLLDEMMAGLNASETALAINLVRRINDRGITVLLIEHNLKVVRSFARRVLVLDRGRLIADGPAEAVLADTAVVTAYLGTRRR
jgi:branched-chain amino acid transport system ATP-binding protein